MTDVSVIKTDCIQKEEKSTFFFNPVLTLGETLAVENLPVKYFLVT